MRGRLKHVMIAVVLFIVAAIAVSSVSAQADDVPLMTVETLKSELVNENLVIVDTRTGSDWRGSEFKIPNAIRGKAGAEKTWADGLARDAKVVIYCA